MLIYARAEGCSTPALLMTPEDDWTVKLFTKIALSTLRADRSKPRVAVNGRTGQEVPSDITLADAGFLPYDLLEFRLVSATAGV